MSRGTRGRWLAVAGLVVGACAVAGPGAGAAAGAGAVVVDLRVDADRDGVVELTGADDEVAEDAAAAAFLPNLDDDTGRCREFDTSGDRPTWLPDRQLDACHDAADRVVNGRADARDLAPIRSAPVSDVPADAIGVLEVVRGANHVRVFRAGDDGWVPVTAATRFTAADLEAGLVLGIEGRAVVREPAVWDGTVTVELTVLAATGTAHDTVSLRVAPLLSHHHLQVSEQVLVTEPWRGDSGAYAQFNRRLGRAVDAAGIPGGLKEVAAGGDIWIQDFVEPMYASMPTADGVQPMRLLLRSDQQRPASRAAYRFRGRDVGVVWMGAPSGRWSTLDSFGNLETIPPYSYDNEDYPAGRIIVDARPELGERPSKRVLTMLRAQGAQDPLVLDTSFLSVGHVDEQLQFVAADTERGWQLAVASPRLGLSLLKQAQRAGAGADPVVSRGDPITVAQALGTGSRSLVADNLRAARIIDANVALLQAETGLTDEEIIEVPTLYRGESFAARSPATRQHIGPSAQRTAAALRGGGAEPPPTQSAYVPGAVNNLVLRDDLVLAATQFAVRVDGRDLFASAVRDAYVQAGIRVRWIDDWDTYHVGSGEVHCGTNSLRDPTAPWWLG